MNSNSSNLQAPATAAAADLAAGMGGSYAVDPASGAVTLQHRTQAATVSKKAPGAHLYTPPAADETPAPGVSSDDV